MENEAQKVAVEEVPHEGTSMKLGGRVFIVPPLSLKQLRTMQGDIDRLSKVGANMTEDDINKALNVILAAFKRNYPTLTIEKLEDMVDLGNLVDVIVAVLGVAGLKKVKALTDGLQSKM